MAAKSCGMSTAAITRPELLSYFPVVITDSWPVNVVSIVDDQRGMFPIMRTMDSATAAGFSEPSISTVAVTVA